MTRNEQWNQAVEKAQEAIDKLITLQEEFEQAVDNPDIEGTELEDQLQSITEIALRDAADILEEARTAELPDEEEINKLIE